MHDLAVDLQLGRADLTYDLSNSGVALVKASLALNDVPFDNFDQSLGVRSLLFTTLTPFPSPSSLTHPPPNPNLHFHRFP